MKKNLLKKMFATALLLVATITASANTEGTAAQYQAALDQVSATSLYYIKATPDGGTTWYYMTSDLTFTTDKSEAVELQLKKQDTSSNNNTLELDGTKVNSFLITEFEGTDGLKCGGADAEELEWSSDGGILWRQQVLFYDGTNFAIRATAAKGGVIYWNYTDAGFSFDNQNGPLFIWQIEWSGTEIEETTVSLDYYKAALEKISSGSNYYIAAIPFGTEDVHYVTVSGTTADFTDDFTNATQFTFTQQGADDNTLSLEGESLSAWRICPITNPSYAFWYTQGDGSLVLDPAETTPLRHQQLLFYNGNGFAIRVAVNYMPFFWQWVADDDPELAGFEFSQDAAHYIWQISPNEITSVESVKSAATTSAIYNASGARLQQMKRGLNIVRMSDGTVKKQIVK